MWNNWWIYETVENYNLKVNVKLLNKVVLKRLVLLWYKNKHIYFNVQLLFKHVSLLSITTTYKSRCKRLRNINWEIRIASKIFVYATISTWCPFVYDLYLGIKRSGHTGFVRIFVSICKKVKTKVKQSLCILWLMSGKFIKNNLI